MSYEFKRLSDVEVVAEPIESANVFIEEDGVIKKAPKTAVGGKEFEQVQSDWNQNDETAPDYIKNRTHYEEAKEVVGDTLTWDGNTEGLVCVVGDNGYAYYFVSDAVVTLDDLKNGMTITETYEGVTEAWENPYEELMEFHRSFEGGFSLSVDSIFCISEDNSNYNGVIFPKTGVYFYKFEDSNVDAITIPGFGKFKSMQTTVKTIDPKFLPEGYPYKEYGKVVFEETVVLEAWAEGLLKADFSVAPDIKAGKEYIVAINGVERTLTAVDMSNEFDAYVSLEEGGQFYMDFGTDRGSGESFNRIVAFIGTVGDAWSVSIKEPDTVHHIDPKFLPEHLQFGTEKTVGDTFTWDGNTDGLEASYLGASPFWYVSDAVVTIDDCKNGALYREEGQADQEIPYEMMLSMYQEYGETMVFVGGTIISIPYDNFDFYGMFFPKAGLYIGRSNKKISVTIPGFGKFESETVKPMDAKYIPMDAICNEMIKRIPLAKGGSF